MARSLPDNELAEKLLSPQIDRTVLDEAARRIKDFDLRLLMGIVDLTSAINRSPLIDKKTASLVESTVMGLVLTRRSPARMSSLAGRILAGGEYDRVDVLSLAACVLSHDDTP